MNFHEAHPAVHISVRYANFYRLNSAQEYSCDCQVSIEGPETHLFQYTRLKLNWIYRWRYDNLKQFQVISESAFIIHGRHVMPAEKNIREVVHKSIDQLTNEVNKKCFFEISMKPLEKFSTQRIQEVVEDVKEKLIEWYELDKK